MVKLSQLTAALTFAIPCAKAQLAGRGFPDCVNGPLKDNIVCDVNAGMYERLRSNYGQSDQQQTLSPERQLS